MKSHYAILAFLGLAVPSQAGLFLAYSNQASLYTPSSTDLINGAAPTAQVGTFWTNESAGGIPVLTDGLYAGFSVGSFATGGAGGGGGGLSLTYGFATSNISSVDVYGGWANNGRDELNFTLQFSSNGGTSFGSALASGSWNPSVAANTTSATKITLSDTTGTLATGVNAMRISFLAVENGYTGYSEIDVNGSAVPEPSGLLLLGLGTIAAMGIRRRK
jgi:PEP-CTERM motif